MNGSRPGGPAASRSRTLGWVGAAFLALLLAALISGIVCRSWIDAQARTIGVLALTGRVPVLAWATREVTCAPHVSDGFVAGVPTTIYRPGGGSRWPALVFLNGVTARGRHHPDVERLARALARIGVLVVVPDPPGLAEGEITARTLTATIAVVHAAADRPDGSDGRVGLLGVSVGASLGLLAAEQPGLADRITLVAGIAPYTDLVNVARLATTGDTLEHGRLVPYAARSFLPLVIARSLVAALPPSPNAAGCLSSCCAFTRARPTRWHSSASFGRSRSPPPRARWLSCSQTATPPTLAASTPTSRPLSAPRSCGCRRSTGRAGSAPRSSSRHRLMTSTSPSQRHGHSPAPPRTRTCG
jgi:pimeloyl-ACP methyl ester carboxylesterase